jgi:DsbC/DsbD-like thiol-disulfide interchange protein
MFGKTLLALILAGFAAQASAGEPAVGSILSGWREDGGRHVAGLAIDLAPGWKTYWRAPGEGGIPPRFNWSGSSNLAGVEVIYPIPKVLDQNGIRALGYDRDVVFPLIVRARDPNQPVLLNAEIEIGVCQEICIPLTLHLTGDLVPSGARDDRIASVLSRQPVPAGTFRCEIEPIADGLRLRASADVGRMPGEVAVIETGEPGIWVSPGETRRDGGRLTTVVEMVPPAAKPFALARSEVRLTVIGDDHRAVEMLGCR